MTNSEFCTEIEDFIREKVMRHLEKTGGLAYKFLMVVSLDMDSFLEVSFINGNDDKARILNTHFNDREKNRISRYSILLENNDK
jgi:hypothetical protein